MNARKIGTAIGIVLAACAICTYANIALASTYKLAGGGQIKPATSYSLVPVQLDGWDAGAKDYTWLNAHNGWFGYSQNSSPIVADISLLVAGNICYTSCPMGSIETTWSTTAPKSAPTISFVEDVHGAIVSAVITAHETVTKEKVYVERKHHKKTYKLVKVVKRDKLHLWAPVPVIGPNQG